MQACAMLTGRAPLVGPSGSTTRASAAHAGGASSTAAPSSSSSPLLLAARRTAGGVRRRWPSMLASHRRAAANSSSSANSSARGGHQQHHPRASSSSSSASSVAEPMLAPSAATEEEAAAGPGPSSSSAAADSAAPPLPHSFFSDDEGEPRPAFLDRRAATPSPAARHRPKPLALAPSTAAQTLSRSLLAHEDAAAGALVGALAGSALGVAYEPEHHTRLPRMFPDGIRDFWTVDLPERPRGRAALENPIVAAVPGRAALEYAAMVACARSLARCGAKVEGADLLDALVDCRRGIAASTAAGAAGAASSPSAAAATSVDASYVVLPPTPRRFSSPYTDLATEAVSTAAATGAADPRTLSTLAEAAMARGFARTAPTASDRPHRREFGAHDFGAATFLGPPLGLAYQDASLEELAGAVDEACAATHPAQSGRDGAAIVAAAVGWLARERRRRRRQEAAGGGGGDDDDASSNGPRALAAYLLESADALRLGSEARDVLSLVAGALGVVASAEGEDTTTAPRPRHPLGSGGPPLDNIVPPALDGAPGRWRVFWASPTWAALSGSAARVAGGSFATTGARLAGVAVLLFCAAGFGAADKQRGNAPAQAVSLAVTMGGACSATASVVGAMAGALHGVGWVPARWWGALEDQLPGDSARATGRAWDGVGKRAAVALGGALGAAAVGGGGEEQ